VTETDATTDGTPMTADTTEGQTPPDDTEHITEMVDERGRTHRVLHGSGAPSEPETLEQGLVRTGRALPEHPADRDSAGLVPEVTEAREAHTREQRDETHRVTTHEGLAADGDVAGGVREEPRL
jgi:hypothetical protein